jgi:hypothetical protein
MAAAIPISWTFNYQVGGGPGAILSTPVINVDAYDVVKVVIAAGATNSTVDLQPDTAAKKVQFVAISADQYDAAKISYTIDKDATVRTLDGPHIFLGSGAVGFMSATAPGAILVTNALATPVTLQVVIGRSVS